MSPAVATRTAGARRFPLPAREWWIPLAHVIVGTASLGFLLLLVVRGGYDPDSGIGVAFGIACAAQLAIVMLYPGRRALASVRSLGPTNTWLRFHIWGGLLFLLLMLVHTGFRYPMGVLMIVLWWLSVWVVVSGLIGLGIQRSVPRLLDALSDVEVNLQRIPELVVDLQSRARVLAERAGPRVRAYYERELAPDMAMPRARPASLLARSRIASYRSQEFGILRRTMPADTVPVLEELFRLHSTKLDIDLQYTLQKVLRLWLHLHLPAAIVLIGVVLMHIFFVLYF